MFDLGALTGCLPQSGGFKAIYLRPARDVHVQAAEWVEALSGLDLLGERSSARQVARTTRSKHQVTLNRAEQLPVTAALTVQAIDPTDLRRNSSLVA